MKSVARTRRDGSAESAGESRRLAIVLLTVFATTAAAANQATFTLTLPGVYFGPIAVDSQGNTYVAGASGANIPTTADAFQTTFTPQVCSDVMFPIECQSAFVIKLNPSGAIVWATYLDGSYGSNASGIAVDAGGNVYVVGSTSSADFPVTPGAAFTTVGNDGGQLGFIAKLNPSGSALVYSTLIPAMYPLALAIDGAGNAYTSGYAAASFPTTAGAFETAPKNPSQPYSGAVLKLNAAGSSVVWATFLCGTVPLGVGDEINGIAVDASGNVAVAGFTAAPDFPVTRGAVEPAPPSSKSTFVSVLYPTGSALVFSTFLSASNNRFLTVRFDSQGGVYVVGEYGTFPITTDAYLSSPGGPFLAHFNAAGALQYGTYLPFVIGQDGESVDLDSAGNLVLAGTAGPGLPTTLGAFQAALAGTYNCYMMKFSPNNVLLGATYLGGSASDAAIAIVAVANGSVVIAGTTMSPDFPGATSASANGGGFVSSLFPALTVQNAADFTDAAIAPGEIVAIRGYGIGPATGQVALAADGALPVSLAGVSVTFGGVAAPLFYVQGQQINVQVPWEIAGQASTEFQIQYQPAANSTTFGPLSVPVAPSAPGIFYIDNPDGSMNSEANPATPGNFIAIYGTGGGLTNPIGVTGAFWPLSTAYPLLALPVTISIGGENATVLYAGASPLNPSGIFQINVLVPADVPSTSAAVLRLKIGTAASVPTPLALK